MNLITSESVRITLEQSLIEKIEYQSYGYDDIMLTFTNMIEEFYPSLREQINGDNAIVAAESLKVATCLAIELYQFYYRLIADTYGCFRVGVDYQGGRVPYYEYSFYGWGEKFGQMNIGEDSFLLIDHNMMLMAAVGKAGKWHIKKKSIDQISSLSSRPKVNIEADDKYESGFQRQIQFPRYRGFYETGKNSVC